jgi:myo-inositol-1(or 4)-monophosphatase
MVANGQLDFYYEKGVHAWDIAAGAIIVREAGGVVMSIDGESFDLCRRQICVSNKLLAEDVQKLVKF